MDFEFYYRKYAPMVHRRCLRLIGNEEKAAEATQDVFLKLMNSKNSIKMDSPSSLLYTMATNISLNILRTHKRKPEVLDSELIHSIVEFEEAEEKRHAPLLLEKIFNREHASTRLIATLHYLDGMTLEEVSKEVDMSVSGIRKRLRTFKESLKKGEIA